MDVLHRPSARKVAIFDRNSNESELDIFDLIVRRVTRSMLLAYRALVIYRVTRSSRIMIGERQRQEMAVYSKVKLNRGGGERRFSSISSIGGWRTAIEDDVTAISRFSPPFPRPSRSRVTTNRGSRQFRPSIIRLPYRVQHRIRILGYEKRCEIFEREPKTADDDRTEKKSSRWAVCFSCQVRFIEILSIRLVRSPPPAKSLFLSRALPVFASPP